MQKLLKVTSNTGDLHFSTIGYPQQRDDTFGTSQMPPLLLEWRYNGFLMA